MPKQQQPAAAEADPIVYRYLAEGNTDADGQPLASLPGVPLRDLRQSDLDAQPRHMRRSIRHSPLYAAAPALGAAPDEEE